MNLQESILSATKTSSKSSTIKDVPSSLVKHGIEVFGTKENFKKWLEKENFFFDKKAPVEFVNTTEGLKFIDDRLTGIEYGDNV